MTTANKILDVLRRLVPEREIRGSRPRVAPPPPKGLTKPPGSADAKVQIPEAD